MTIQRSQPFNDPQSEAQRALWKELNLDESSEPQVQMQALFDGAQEKKKKKSFISIGFVIYLAVTVLLAWTAYTISQSTVQHDLSWDPFAILGIEPNADAATVKKRYRELTLRYHPDRISEEDKAQAEDKFIEINKAYKIMTDEVARTNWEKFGNPDGEKTFALGMALPLWLVEKDNKFYVLLAYGAVLGVLIPWLVNKWWSNAKKFTRDAILNHTMSLYYSELRESMQPKKLLELLSASLEYREWLPWRGDDALEVEQLTKQLKEHGFVPSKTYTAPYALKAHALLYAHLIRFNVSSPRLLRDQAAIVAKALHLIQGAQKITLAKSWLSTTLNCIQLSQMLVQALDGVEMSELQMLPFVDEEVLKHCKNKKKPIKNLDDLISLSQADRDSLLRQLNDNQRATLERVMESIPRLLVKHYAFKVSGEKRVIAGSIVTLHVFVKVDYGKTLADMKKQLEEGNLEKEAAKALEEDDNAPGKRLRALDDEVVGSEDESTSPLLPKDPNSSLAPVKAVYAPRLAIVKRPFWYFFLCEPRARILIGQPKKISELAHIKFQFQAPQRPGTYVLQVVLKSDSYYSTCDLKHEVRMEVVDASQGEAVESEDDISEDEGILAQARAAQLQQGNASGSGAGVGRHALDSEDDD